jgi:ferredoxin
MTDEVRVEVEADFCVGAANCVRAAPEAFELSDEGLSVVTNPAAATPEQLLEAQRSCPSGAIRVLGLAASPPTSD